MSDEPKNQEDLTPQTESRWYVVHTYSGYENKVKANIEKIVDNRLMHDLIHEISVPVQEVVEIKNEKKKTYQRKVFPGYVLIKMIMNDDTWYVVRNTRGVTSFVGPGSKPVPLTDEEVQVMGIENYVKGEKEQHFDFELGESVQISSGAFADSIGPISEINLQKGTIIVKLLVFGRETPVELDFSQVIKI